MWFLLLRVQGIIPDFSIATECMSTLWVIYYNLVNNHKLELVQNGKYCTYSHI